MTKLHNSILNQLIDTDNIEVLKNTIVLLYSEKIELEHEKSEYLKELLSNSNELLKRQPNTDSENKQKTIKDIIIQTLLDNGFIKRGYGNLSDTYIFLYGLNKTFSYLFENKLLTEHSKPDMFFSFCYRKKDDKCIYEYDSEKTIKTEFSRVKNKFYPKQ